MKFSKFLASLLVSVFVVSTVPVSSAASFSEPKVASVYSKIVRATDKKVAKISGISASDRKKIVDARANLERAFVAFDAAFRKPSEEKARAGRVLVRAYSDLNAVIAASMKASSSAPSAGQVSVAAASTVSALSIGADVLYYSDDFENSGTSNGDRFSQSAYSAARCGIDLGRLIQVGYGSKSVVVKVNDRPSCSRHPDIVDLSTSAFQALAPLSKGRLKGSFEVLGQTPSGYRKEPLSASAFSGLGIKLDEKIPNTYLVGETIRVSGRVTDGKEDTVFFLKSPSGKRFSRAMPVAGDSFSYEAPLLEPGKYDLVIASGMGFSTSKTQSVYVFSDDVFASKKILSSASVPLPVSELRFTRKESSDLTPMNVLDLPDTEKNVLRTVRISQPGAETLVRRSMGDVAFLPEDAARFDANKPVRVTIATAESSTPFSIDVFGKEASVFDAELPLVSAYATERKEAISASVEGSTLRVRTDLAANAPALRNEAYLIAPSGNVITQAFPSNALGADGYVARGKKTEFEIPLHEDGQYMFEVMYATGFPAFNGPVSHGAGAVPLLQNEYDAATKDTDSDLSDVVPNALRFVNAVRKKVGKAALVSDPDLDRLARFKANDMADHNYVGHDDSAGQKIIGTATRAGITIAGSVGENVAGGSVGTDFLLAGLSLSGGHRANMLGDWNKIGVAAVVKNGLTYYVQVYGE